MPHLLRLFDANEEVTKVSDILSKYKKATHIREVALIMFMVHNETSGGKETTTNDQGPSSQPPPSSGGADGDKKEKRSRSPL